MKKRIMIFLVGIFALTSGLYGQELDRPRVQKMHLATEAGDRVYYIRVPENSEGSWRVLYVIHGYQPIGADHARGLIRSLENTTDLTNTLVIAPTLLDTRRAGWKKEKDATFIGELHTDLMLDYGTMVDPNQIASIGHSMGVKFLVDLAFDQIVDLKAVVGMGGGMTVRTNELDKVPNKIPVFFMVGAFDTPARQSYAYNSYRKLAWKKFPNARYWRDPRAGHNITYGMMKRAFRFFDKVLPKTPIKTPVTPAAPIGTQS